MLSSQSESSEEEHQKPEKGSSSIKDKSVKKQTAKVISKQPKKANLASRKDMHGATVVPVAAHLKYKKLLEKK